MPWRNSQDRYGAVAQTLHWAMALLIVCLVGLGWYMTDLETSPRKFELYGLHKSTGMVVLALAVVRLAWRLVNPAPPLPAGMPRWETGLAKGAHHAIYALLFLVPVSGYLFNATANFPLSIYGLFTVPNLVGPSETLKPITQTAHHWLGSALVGILLLHVAGALKHHFVSRDDVLTRMLPRFRRDPGGP